MMNYKNLFLFFGIGTLVLAVLFTLINTDYIIKSTLITILIIGSIFYGAFKKER